MDIPIHQGDPAGSVPFPGVTDGDGSGVEQAEAHRLHALGMVARRPHGDEGVRTGAAHHRIHGMDRAADTAQGRVEGAG